MQFSPAERILMRSHAKVLEMMAAQWDELLNRRDPRSREAVQLREFRDLYRSLAAIHAENTQQDEPKAA